jgi:phosphate-selective porin OprO/OprP
MEPTAMKRTRSWSVLVASWLVGWFTGLPIPVAAQDPPPTPEDAGWVRRDEYDALVKRLETLESGTVAPKPPVERTYPDVRLSGVFQLDWLNFNQDDANKAVVGDLENGTDFRRARLQALGKLHENVNFSLEFDFGTIGRPSFMDVWLELDDFADVARIRVGHFREPVGLDAMTSVRSLTFLERALPMALVPFRRTGVMAHGHDQDQTTSWAIGGFRTNADPFGGDVGDNSGYSLASRLTHLVWYDERSDGRGYMHVGGAFSWEDPDDRQARFFAQPEVFEIDVNAPAIPSFVDTGFIPATQYHVAGAESIINVGSFCVQGELLFASVDQIGAPALYFPGYYVQAGYMLTGEHRPYDRNVASAGRIRPLENFFAIRTCQRDFAYGTGAWEVATRLSGLDLSNETIRGGNLTDWTVGLNWYWNPRTKLQFNYIHAWLNRDTGNSEADIIAVRAQADF